MKDKITKLPVAYAIFFAFTLLLAYIFKASFSDSTTNDLSFILSPTSKLVEIITSTSFYWVSGKGYAMEGNAVVINKSCSGINFFIIAFTMVSFMCTASLHSFQRKFLGLLLSLTGGFLLTIIVNAFRISTAIFFINHLPNSNPFPEELFHHLQGILFYFSFLLLYYLFIKQMLTKAGGKTKDFLLQQAIQ